MANEDRNRRSAGYRRVNAVFERLRAKADRLAARPPAAEPLAPPDPTAPGSRLVLLLADPPAVTPAGLRRAAGAAFPTAGRLGVTAAPSGVVVRAGGWGLTVAVGTGPVVDPAAADRLAEQRLRAAVRDHAGWLAVEVEAAPAGATDLKRAAAAGRLLAAAAPADALALYRPGTGRVGLYTPAAAALLADGLVAPAFRPLDHPVPIAGVADGDPRMSAAVAEANRRFGEFLAALSAREPGETFAVKVPFADPNGREFMWVSVAAVDDAYIFGRLDNEPAFVKTVAAGEPVRVPRAELNDWLYVRDGHLYGGFTLRLLDDTLRPGRPEAA
ncbi:MAG: DUF2314 domain-containing protein [Gemmataceae bacterium]